MNQEEKVLQLFNIVELSFQNAVEQPDVARWKSCAQLASVAAKRIASDGDTFRAAALAGVEVEAKRQQRALEEA